MHSPTDKTAPKKRFLQRTLSKISMENLLPKMDETKLNLEDIGRQYWNEDQAYWLNPLSSTMVEPWLTKLTAFTPSTDKPGEYDFFKSIYVTIMPRFGSYMIMVIKRRKVPIIQAKLKAWKIIRELYQRKIIKTPENSSNWSYTPPILILQPVKNLNIELPGVETLETVKYTQAHIKLKIPDRRKRTNTTKKNEHNIQ